MTATSVPPHSQRRDVAVLVPAAGQGVRLGSGPPKALRTLAGVPLLVHAVQRLTAAPSTGVVVVAAPPGQCSDVARLVPGAIVVAGGANRRESVAAALAAVPGEYEIVLVHDAARALTPPEQVESVAAAVRAGSAAVIPALPVADTIKEITATGVVVRTVDRAALRAVQTPQGFQRSVLVKAHRAGRGAGSAATDDAGLVEALGIPVHVVAGHAYAMKITTPTDLVVAEALLAAGHPQFRHDAAP